MNEYLYEHKKSMSILMLLFSLMLMVNIMFFQYTVARASIATVALALTEAAEIAGVATILTAAGITIAAGASVYGVAKWWYSSAGEEVRQSIKNALTYMVDGTITLTNDIWESARDFVQTTFTVGANLGDIGHYYEYTDSEGLVYPYTDIESQALWTIGKTFTLNGDSYELKKRTGYTDFDCWRLYRNGEMLGTADILLAKGSLNASVGLEEQNGNLNAWAYYEHYADGMKVSSLASAIATGVVVGDLYGYDLTGEDVLTNPTWDIENEGERQVAIPVGAIENPDLVAGNTYADVIAGTGTGSLSVDVTPDDFTTNITNKLNIGPLSTAWERLNNINTAKGDPPVIKINLHSILNAGTSHIAPGTMNPFADEDTVFIDFGVLENYQFGGYSVVDYFRTLIGAGFIYTTLLYIWRKLIPDKAVS